jgi:NADH dehydrogenase
MSSQTVVIVGGGFAGLAAARRLGGHRGKVRTILFDPRETSDFLPLLPDIVGGRLGAGTTQYPLEHAARRFHAEYVSEAVQEIDLSRRILRTSQTETEFDYLILTCGSVSNFHGTPGAEAHAFPVKSASEADRLSRAVADRHWRQVIVCGGGYTGVEIATHVKNRFRKNQDEREVLLLDNSDRILRGMPEGFRRYTEENLRRMEVRVLAGTTVKRICDNGSVLLSNGTQYPRALVAWSAGVKTPGFVEDLGVELGPGGRVVVDENLGFADGCFAAGDAAHVNRRGKPLRMGIQFSLMGGYRAAENVLRSINRKPLRRFNPLDPGYIVPMANGRSCGNVMRVRLYGRMATFLHYFMCGFRTWGVRNRRRMIRELFGGCEGGRGTPDAATDFLDGE